MQDGTLVVDTSALAIRDMTSDDLVSVLVVERNVHISPWSRLSFEESLTMQESAEDSLENKKYICRVVTSGHVVIAYLVVCPIADELHILNIATASQYQGLGIGHLLMEEIIRLAAAMQKTKIFLEVRASNEVAQNLYLKWQFEKISIRKRYYSMPNSSNTNDREDAFVFMRHLRNQA